MSLNKLSFTEMGLSPISLTVINFKTSNLYEVVSLAKIQLFRDIIKLYKFRTALPVSYCMVAGFECH
jgi:hypothetical protein